MKTLKELIEELRAGFMPEPEEAPREVERLNVLCEEAADLLHKQSVRIKELEDEKRADPYNVLSSINVNDHIEKKNGLSYLSWAWAWDILMTYYPDSYTSVMKPSDTNYPYWTDNHTCWVAVSVTIVWDGKERTRTEYFPIMDYKNRSIPADKVTSFDVNTALQRAWTKCIARHGLGFYIYAGQDLPNEESRERDELIQKVMGLYSPEEITKMLTRQKWSSLEEAGIKSLRTMVAKRDQSLVESQEETF